VTGHGRRFRKLAEEHLAPRFRVVAPDLRGHGRSGWEPPWRIETHVADVLETVDDLGIERVTLVGHSFGGRLAVELAARAPERIERVVLLDAAIQVLPGVALRSAEDYRRERAFDSVEDAIRDRLAGDPGNPLWALEEEMREHLDPGDDGKLRPRVSQAAVVAIYGELATEPPAPETLRAPTLLVYAPAFGLVREEQVSEYAAALGERLTIVPVEGGHMVYWDAYEQTAAAIDAFLADASE
jgi:lipase